MRIDNLIDLRIRQSIPPLPDLANPEELIIFCRLLLEAFFIFLFARDIKGGEFNRLGNPE